MDASATSPWGQMGPTWGAEVLPKLLSIVSQQCWLTGQVAGDWSLASGTPEKSWKEHPGSYSPGRCEAQQDRVPGPTLELQQPCFHSWDLPEFINRQTCLEWTKEKNHSFVLGHWMVNLPPLISSVPDKAPTNSVLPCNKFVLLGFFPSFDLMIHWDQTFVKPHF